MIGLDGAVSTLEGQVLASVAIAMLAFGAVYLARRGRGMASERFNPVVADFAGAVLVVWIVVSATMAIVEIWGQTDVLLAELDGFRISERAPEIAVTVVVIVALQVFAGIARRLLDDLTRESNAMTEHQREVSYRLTQLLLWTVGLIVVLGVWDVNLGGLLIGAGFLGIVVGMAARKTLGSLLAGFVLMFSRPFEVGDWIEVEGEEGIVTDITMMNTRIQAFDGQYVVVPNDNVSSQLVKNRSRQGRLRIEVEVGIDYDADVDRAREIATETVRELDEVMDVPKPETVVKELGDSSVLLGVRAWIENPSSRRRWRARTAMIREAKAALDEESVKIPYPQRELTGRQEEGGLRVTGDPEDSRDSTEAKAEEPSDGSGAVEGSSDGSGPTEGSSDGSAPADDRPPSERPLGGGDE